MNMLFLRAFLQNCILQNCILQNCVPKHSRSCQRSLRLCLLACAGGVLASCSGYPRILSFPFDAAGRGLNSPAAETMPQVSSQYIAFISERDGRQDVYLYDANARQLIDLPGLNTLDAIASHPSVTENGRYIVFAASRKGESDIYMYDRTTRQLRNLTTTLRAEVRHPTISADGNIIAFESSAAGQWDILVYDKSGKPLDIPITPR